MSWIKDILFGGAKLSVMKEGDDPGRILFSTKDLATMSKTDIDSALEWFREYGDSWCEMGDAEEEARYNRPEDTRRSKFNGIRDRAMIRLISRDGAHCKSCGTTSNLSVDHIIPLARSGTDDLDNLQILCKSCNSRKGAR